MYNETTDKTGSVLSLQHKPLDSEWREFSFRINMIKDVLRTTIQKLLGFNNYLVVFALFNIMRMRARVYDKEFRFFIEMVPPSGAILDIGANIGVMSVILAQKFPHATIYSFEPVPCNFRAMERIVSLHKAGNILVYPIALGNKNGTIRMTMPLRKQAGMHGLSYVVTDESATGENLFSVPVKRIDDLETLQTVKGISAIKIDVENYEWYVLKGGEALLRKHRPIVYCELWNNENRVHCIEFIRSIGYRVMILKKGALVQFTGQDAINFFFLP